MKENFKIAKYTLATKNTRFINFILDLLILYFISLLLNFISSFIPLNEDYPTFSHWIYALNNVESYLYSAFVSFLYFTVTETLLSRSIAKYFTKTVVVLEDGTKPKLFTILARSILRQVPFEAFTFLCGRKRGLHDKNSNTFVVKKDKLEKNKRDYQQNISH